MEFSLEETISFLLLKNLDGKRFVDLVSNISYELCI